MNSRLLLMAGLLMVAAPALAQELEEAEPQRIHDPRPWPTKLISRQAAPKPPIVHKPLGVESRMVVKFRDEVKARAVNGRVRSLANANLADIRDVANQFDLTFSRAFDIPEEAVSMVEKRAALNSGKAQPDLNGFMFVDGPMDTIVNAANALNALGQVEFVEFLSKPILHSDPPQAAQGMADEGWTALEGEGGEDGPIPNLTGLQYYKDGLFVDKDGSGTIDAFGPDGNPLTLPDNEFVGGFNVDLARQFGEILIKQGHTRDWDPDLNGALGDTIRVGVIEDSAEVDRDRRKAHVDLRHVILEPGQRLLDRRIVDRNHGTATLGEIAAKDHGLEGPDWRAPGDNAELGIIGMVPRAKPWFFPTATVDQPGGRLMSSILSAFSFFDRGDVLSLSIGFPDGPLVTSEAMGVLFQAGTDLGITSVMSAGNECLKLEDDSYPIPVEVTGVIIVGAGLPINPGVDPECHPYIDDFSPPLPPLNAYTRLGFSNHHSLFDDDSQANHDENPVMVQGWGAAVVTCGYGDLFGGDEGLPPTRWYTANFGGTSAAAPMIAATVVAAQGLAKMFYGIPLAPTQIRDVIASNYWCQDTTCPPFEEFISGTEDDTRPATCNDACLTFSPVCCPLEDRMIDPTQSISNPDLIGGQPSWEAIGPSLFSSDFFDESIIVDAIPLRGEFVFGNFISLMAPDNNPLIMEAEFGEPGRETGGPLPPRNYVFAGYMTDVGVIAQVDTPSRVQSITVQSVLSSDRGFVMGIESYNFELERWVFLGVGFPTTVFTFQPPEPVELTPAYINQSTGEIYVRVWVLGMGFNNRDFLSAIDWVLFDVNTGGFGD